MRIAKTREFVRRYRKLPKSIQKKVDKQIRFLAIDIFHPSLRTKRMRGVNYWEGRIDIHYRMTFEKAENIIVLKNDWSSR